MSDTLGRDAIVCNGCDALTLGGSTFYLFDRCLQRVAGTYCGACAEKHRRGEPVPRSRFPRTAAFSLDGKTWTACDLRDAPA